MRTWIIRISKLTKINGLQVNAVNIIQTLGNIVTMSNGKQGLMKSNFYDDNHKLYMSVNNLKELGSFYIRLSPDSNDPMRLKAVWGFAST